MKRTIFERYGGFAKISRVVMSFYDKILDSPITSPYFSNTDMRRLIDHQTRFMATIMGGPASYTNDQLERLHAHLKINNEAFLEAVNLLVETLEDYDFEDEDILFVKDDMMSRKNFIVASISAQQEPS
jgi:hemoglobin